MGSLDRGGGARSSYLAADYASKSSDYYNNARRDIVAALPDDPTASILELGCGTGDTGALASRKGKCGRYVGIEMFEPAALQARNVLTAVHVGDVSTVELPYAPETFDALVMSEVLEHLVDPDSVLERLLSLIKPGGLVFASSPNVAHWRLVRNLVFGRFDYEAAGVMDRTHLRWFTPTSYAAMFERAGVAVERLEKLGQEQRAPLYDRVVPSRLRHLFWTQINLVGRKRAVS